jgi:hypothetical protein
MNKSWWYDVSKILISFFLRTNPSILLYWHGNYICIRSCELSFVIHGAICQFMDHFSVQHTIWEMDSAQDGMVDCRHYPNSKWMIWNHSGVHELIPRRCILLNATNSRIGCYQKDNSIAEHDDSLPILQTASMGLMYNWHEQSKEIILFWQWSEKNRIRKWTFVHDLSVQKIRSVSIYASIDVCVCACLTIDQVKLVTHEESFLHVFSERSTSHRTFGNPSLSARKTLSAN